MEEERKPEFEHVQPNEPIKVKKPINKFVIKYIVFVIILILITAIGTYFSIRYIDQTTNENQLVEEPNDKNDYEVEEKNKAEDSIYGIKSYSETYDTNALEIKHYYDLDGTITREELDTVYETRIEFIQIDGLKNKDIQNKINTKLKNTPYSLEKEKYAYSHLSANFSNVLSVVFSSDKENVRKTLNFDLTTGEEIMFQNLFVSSAPIKSMIAGGMYEQFAWDKLYENYEVNDGLYDMEKVDTSEIEEQFLLAAQKYDKIKDNIVFYFSANSINILNPELIATINMVEYANEIAIYKRYLTEETIYENDDLGIKDTIVFTEDINFFGKYAEQLSYGKIADNIFVEELYLSFDESLQEDNKTIMDYINKLSQERKTILEQNISSNQGVIFQGEYYAYKVEEKGYYCITVNYYKAECTLSYFEDEAFRNYIEVKGLERADVGLNAFTPYMQEDYPEMQISEIEYKTYYLSPTGEFLGNTEEEIKNKAWE